MARASGLVLAGGAEGNDPLGATTTGTGELIDHALDAGARKIIVGVGGSATTDGGFGAIRAINGIARLRRVELLVACDVTTRFLDAATVFAPQKGATTAQVAMLTRRLQRLAQLFVEEFGVDVRDLDGGGAAGGLGAALAAIGGRLLPGFELIADELDLFDQLDPDPEDPDAPPRPDLVVTGEGRLDATSFDGKVVGGLLAHTRDLGIPLVAIVGEIDDAVGVVEGLDVVSIGERFGPDIARRRPRQCIEQAAAEAIERHLSR
jgi:glycerate kinase